MVMKNQELEIKLKLEEWQFQSILKLLSDNQSGEMEEQVDLYYCPKESNYKDYMERKCLRVRKNRKKCSLDYKEIIDTKEKYAQKLNEYSTEILNMQQMDLILDKIGFSLILEIRKERYEFVYNDLFKISLDKVKELGFFIEIEIINQDLSYEEANNYLKKEVETLGLSNNLINKEGYSNMMYQIKYGREV